VLLSTGTGTTTAAAAAAAAAAATTAAISLLLAASLLPRFGATAGSVLAGLVEVVILDRFVGLAERDERFPVGERAACALLAPLHSVCE
jgi:hypothetical protein